MPIDRVLRGFLGLAVWMALGASFVQAGRATDDPKLSADDLAFFETKIRPILVERCDACHSAGAEKIRGHLRLDSKPGWERGGDLGPAIEPGAPDESNLILAIRYDDSLANMPPKGKLPDAEIAALEEWVRRAAPDPRTSEPEVGVVENGTALADAKIPAASHEHWAFDPLEDVEPPAVNGEEWVRNPIDRFVLAKLEADGLSPAPEADRSLLIRRAYFDLIGLPPTPEELDEALGDSASDWYERLVARLLDRPQFGERWARHWLDLARYAESHGFEHDYDRPTAYTYRDFVVEAFNRDLPFDIFAAWQIAGDELAPDDPLALKATGFLAAGTHSTQITKNQVEKERYDELDDMIATTGTAFLGLTIGCARCHDHKFDPIPTAEYYGLAATFTTTVRTEVELPIVPSEYAEELAKYEAEHAPYLEAIARDEAGDLPRRLAEWESDRDRTPGPVRWTALLPSKAESAGGALLEVGPAGIVASGTNPDFDTYTIVAPCDLAAITAIRLDALADPSLPHGGPGRASNGNFALTDVDVEVGPRYGIGPSSHPKLINPKATFEQEGLPVLAAVDADPKSGWAVDPEFGRDHAAAFELASETPTAAGSTVTITLKFANNAGHNLGRFRLSATDVPRPVPLDHGDGVPASIRPILATKSGDRSPEQTSALRSWFATIDPTHRALVDAAEVHAASAPQSTGEKALISSEGLPAVRLHTQGPDFLEATHLLLRGDPNQKSEVAEPGFLSVLVDLEEGESPPWIESPPEGSRTSYRRKALAGWLTDVDRGAGRLLARVIVNRLWQHHYGRGLVATPSDFGRQGEPPSHPELLNWLASELIRGGWRLKPIHALMMTSAAYRQGDTYDSAHAAIDPENRLFWRREPRRLEAEAIRDAMLAASGLLDPRMGGPGTLDGRMRRRAIYFTVKRSQLIPFLTLFDAPDALAPIASRSSTTVAPQALWLLNGPVVREWAAALAERASAPGADRAAAVARAYRLALSRSPAEAETAAAIAFLETQAASHRAAGRPPDEADLDALTDFVQVLFGLNEFLYID